MFFLWIHPRMTTKVMCAGMFMVFSISKTQYREAIKFVKLVIFLPLQLLFFIINFFFSFTILCFGQSLYLNRNIMHTQTGKRVVKVSITLTLTHPTRSAIWNIPKKRR